MGKDKWDKVIEFLTHSNRDPQKVLNLLKDLQQQFNLTYIFISHDMAVVKHMADRMMVMNQGKIEELGYPDDIYNNPQKEYTQRLVNAIPRGIKVI